MVTRSQPAGTRRKARESAPARPERRRAPSAAPAADSPVAPSLLMSLARQVQAWSGSILGGVGTATDVAMTLAQSKLQRPGPKAAVSKAAALLRDLREAAGLTVEDLGRLLELDDPSLMGLVESGKVGLPFDVILRLAAVLGRNDPIGFILQMTRSYNPRTWKTLEALGIGKLVVQAGREREFANIYRSHDAARNLSDADFAAALAFTDAAFKTALAFHAGLKPASEGKKPPAAPAKKAS